MFLLTLLSLDPAQRGNLDLVGIIGVGETFQPRARLLYCLQQTCDRYQLYLNVGHIPFIDHAHINRNQQF